MLQKFIKKNPRKEKAFQRKTGILIKILIPLLVLSLPIIFLSYSDLIARILLPHLPEGTIQKIPFFIQDIEFQTRLILVLTLTLALFLGALISRHFSRALGKISVGLEKILAGDLNFRIKVESRDEIGEVTYLLNRLTESLKTSQLKLIERDKELKEKSLELTEKIKSLEASSQEAEKYRLATLNILEDVEEARLALQERLEELEKFNKLAVGRELKMIELKEEIKRLETELSKITDKKNYGRL